MKYIKSVDDFKINEELDLKAAWKNWKSYLITIGLFAGVSNYSSIKTNVKTMIGYELNQSEISNIVNDVEYEPIGKNKVMVDTIKRNLISYIRKSDKIVSSDKESVIKGIRDIKIVMAPDRFADAIGRSNVMGVHFLYVDYPTGEIKNAVVLNSSVFDDAFSEDSDGSKTTTLIHELWHFIDFKLNKKDNYGYSSDIIDLSLLLDMDIVKGAKVGDEKLKRKIIALLKLQGKSTNKEMISAVTKMITNKREYLTNPAEVYARYHSMKVWMYNKGLIKDPHDKLTKGVIMEMLMKFDITKSYDNQSIDFFELLFYMKIDFDSDDDNDKDPFSGFNTLVANYRDFDKIKRDV